MAGEARSWYAQALTQAQERGIDPAEVDYLVEAVSGLDRLRLRLLGPEALGPFEDKLTKLWRRRLSECVPVQYLTGRAYWRDLELQVNPAVLIPRPETELLADLAIAFCQSLEQPLLADLGTGSGAIAVAVARALPTATLWATDISKQALAVADANIRTYGLTERIHLVEGDWFSPLPLLAFDCLISNPPYIPSAEVDRLMPEVRLHEPRLALDGGADGLETIRLLVAKARRYLRPGGLVAIELMAGQAAAVVELIEKAGQYDQIRTVCDWSGIERFVCANAWQPGS
ncbi:peptide chain release factor N(5)-glutamine methyltransferase [Gloeobacter kilaueensis]|uniref:Release factor glutamine methyltransferase n=1 Tax=Gloeobacter kilaueensis (strain ATCC BAA-2537 / CCAP 1431/1 / ULC 316 / JS1) TaxID=1183438 RepID=U5QF33_GLOK1|nr:peptide chain release factor N(5)-glutamine methyltransferase [Gloeobacter kilaueensis]AGY57473.1 protein-(glutamine-N5) methyltransferase, release factor-specific [Gloeobacter kilaueensis JS1]